MESDSLILVLGVLSILIPTGVLLWSYYRNLHQKPSLIQTKIKFSGQDGGKILFLGSDEMTIDDYTFNAVPYVGTIIEEDNGPDLSAITIRDDITKLTTTLTSVSNKYNRILLYAGGQSGKINIYGCNVDFNGRIFPWNTTHLAKAQRIYDEVLEDRIRHDEQEKLKDLTENKTLLVGEELRTNPMPRTIQFGSDLK